MSMTSGGAELGGPAPPFSLPRADGKGTVALDDLGDAPVLLVAFLCVHCPYVQNIESALGVFAAEYAEKGLAVVGISANDVANYPEDAPSEMAKQATRAGFTFPYLYDETQEVAKAYGATCTPDLFVYDALRHLSYRGQFDGSRPRNDVPPTGESLRTAVDLILAGKPVPEPHLPSVGCGLKWKPGNEPPVRLEFW